MELFCCRCPHELEDHETDDPAMPCLACACPTLTCQCGHGSAEHTEELPMACTVCRCDRVRLGDAPDEEAAMSEWIKMHHTTPPKFTVFGPLRLEALGLYMAINLACDAGQTDGWVSREMVQLAGALLDPPHVEKFVEGFLRHGLLVHGDNGGYDVVGYLDAQRSAERIREEARASTERSRKLRAKQKSGGNAVADAVADAVGNAVRDGADGDGDGEGDGEGKKQNRSRRAALPPASPDGEPLPESAWSGYSRAFEARYRTPPLRNGKINGVLAQFEKRVPVSDAAAVAAYYVQSETRLYVNARHPVELLLRDAEKLWSEWKTGTRTESETAGKLLGATKQTAGNLDAGRRWLEMHGQPGRSELGS